jgi:hypothetical protein
MTELKRVFPKKLAALYADPIPEKDPMDDEIDEMQSVIEGRCRDCGRTTEFLEEKRDAQYGGTPVSPPRPVIREEDGLCQDCFIMISALESVLKKKII